jgi:ATP-dependent Lhr-like helicase
MASITRLAPVSLYLREDREWLTAARPSVEVEALSSDAQAVLEALRAQGAMFATDILRATPLLPGQLDNALGELVVRGLITSDGIAGLRSLVRAAVGADQKESARRRRPRVVRRRRSSGTTGRWSVWRNDTSFSEEPKATASPTSTDRERRREVVEQWAWQMIRRWGVVFKDLLRRETGAPPWWELVQVYRRLEARGELRGGRFIKGVAGEQFALADAIRELRACRDAEPSQQITVLSGADPLNLIGIVTGDVRVPATAGNRIAWLDGRPVAARESGELRWLGACPEKLRPAVLERLGVHGSERRVQQELREQNGDGDVKDESAQERPRGKRRARAPSGIPRPLIS